MHGKYRTAPFLITTPWLLLLHDVVFNEPSFSSIRQTSQQEVLQCTMHLAMYQGQSGLPLGSKWHSFT
jgi:hypothetical protein